MVLQCSATVLKEQLKLCLAAEGFGNRLCFLEPTSNAQVCAGQRERGSDEQRGWDLKKGVRAPSPGLWMGVEVIWEPPSPSCQSNVN